MRTCVIWRHKKVGAHTGREGKANLFGRGEKRWENGDWHSPARQTTLGQLRTISPDLPAKSLAPTKLML